MRRDEYRGVCANCGKDVRGPNIAKEITCWVTERGQGGANAAQGPDKRETGRIMHAGCHAECLMRERNHIAKGQLTIAP